MKNTVRIELNPTPDFERKLADAVRGKIIAPLARAVEAEAQRLVSTPGPTPSSPGKMPHSESGELLASIQSTVTIDQQRVLGRVVANVPYAMHLEFGTSRMAARPFLRPALAHALAEFKRNGQ